MIELISFKDLIYLKILVEPNTRVIRLCGWDNSTYQGRCYQRAGFGGRQEVCACFGDNCNSGNSLNSLFSATILSAVIILFARV